MAGVIDDKGQQWEHCLNCGDWVKIQRLSREDLCPSCARCTPRGRAELRAQRLPKNEKLWAEAKAKAEEWVKTVKIVVRDVK
jgi:hypothetical protein